MAKSSVETSFNLPFKEQIEFFKQKVAMPSEKWTDFMGGMHARAFVVAGATRDELLSDFQKAILEAKESGMGMDAFREKFDDIVSKHGWEHNGEPGWRSRIIYNTNMRTAYMSGRYKQMTDPDVVSYRPFWEYKHGNSMEPRPEHLAWDGLVLPWDDPWWDTHYPPNGWGCTCEVIARSERDLARQGKTVSEAPEERLVPRIIGDGETVMVPEGIDPGWDYNVGKAAWGKPVTDEAMEEFKEENRQKWEPITPGDWESEDRPRDVPPDDPEAEIWPAGETLEQTRKRLEESLGGKEKVFEYEGKGFKYPIHVQADSLLEHLPPDRHRYLAFLEEVIKDPFEVWASFERHKLTGKVALRFRFIKAHAVDGKEKGIFSVADASNGRLNSYTFFPPNSQKYLRDQRRGKLVGSK